jgi:hypothetical protein
VSNNGQAPPKGQGWVWLSRELVDSDAFRSLSINALRFIRFLLSEHMRKGGQENGNLKAPYGQLAYFGGITRRLITGAICEVERVGLVDCKRGGKRVATAYMLTWLPAKDGKPATNRWRTYSNPDLRPIPPPKKQKSTPTSGTSSSPTSGTRWPDLPPHREPDDPQI